MKRLITVCLMVVFTTLSIAQNTVYYTIETSMGNIDLELYKDKAPKTVENFLNYVDSDLYKNSSFFRVCTPENEAEREIKIEVIQGGNVDESKAFPPIEIETTEQTSVLHENGAISMARAEPNTATSSFFICIGDQKELDYKGKRNPDGYGFAAFGKVISGMDVVLKIQKEKDENQMLINPVLIKNIVKTNLK